MNSKTLENNVLLINSMLNKVIRKDIFKILQ